MFIESQSVLKEISAELALGETSFFKEPRILGKWVLWLEQRPQEGGRTTALIRPWGRIDLAAQELTPFPINLRTRLHGYGGGVLTAKCLKTKLLLSWVDDSDGCLWLQVWEDSYFCKDPITPYWRSIHSPLCLSETGNYTLSDGIIDLFRNRWIGLMEKDSNDYIVSFSLNIENQLPSLIYQPIDFAGYLTLSPDSNQLAWIEWQQPSMPWESSQLWWGTFNEEGMISNIKQLAGSFSKDQVQKSVFQPVWLPSGELLVAEDSSGWWNLMMLEQPIQSQSSPIWKRLWPMEAEFGMPQWICGMSTIASAGKKIVAISCLNGYWSINLLARDGSISKVDQPFNDLSGLHAASGRIVAIASNSTKESGLLEVDLTDGSWLHTSSRASVLDENQISVPKPFWFKGFKGSLTHSWFYPPAHWDGLPAPLLVKIHSGPTGMATTGLNLGIQFWTSRGWGVVDVNYGGSTGFGRLYRERLKRGWGEVDVNDCVAAVKTLVAKGKVDRRYIAIEGGSAGGFTALACLCFTDIFKVASCRYPVTDLIGMKEKTHRFEEGYLDHLVGIWPEERQIYKKRSPLHYVEQIKCPVILFQGLKDKVVLPDQTELMAMELRKNNIPVELHTFPNESHGFKDRNVKIKTLEATEKFFNKHLNF